jgi:hypothetical protein
MEEKTAGDPADSDGAAGDLFGLPDLPSLTKRWTVRRKAAVIEAVRGGWVPIEEVCRLYNLSVDEFLAWERDVDRYGVPGLRATRYQSTASLSCGSHRRSMALRHSLTEQLALSMLAREGIAVIWQLQVAAADAHRSGHPQAAASILKIAEAAEAAWLRAEGAQAPAG